MAEPSNWAVVGQDGTIQNVIYWNGEDPWPPPPDTTMVPVPPGVQAEVGGNYDSQTDEWTRVPEGAPPEEIHAGEQDLAAVIEALKTIPEISQALAANGIEVVLDENGDPTGVVVIKDEIIIEPPMEEIPVNG